MRALLPMVALLSLAWTRDRIALVVENRSSSEKAAAELTPAISEVLASKGYEVVPQPEVAAALQTIGTDADGALQLPALEKLRKPRTRYAFRWMMWRKKPESLSP